MTHGKRTGRCPSFFMWFHYVVLLVLSTYDERTCRSFHFFRLRRGTFVAEQKYPKVSLEPTVLRTPLVSPFLVDIVFMGLASDETFGADCCRQNVVRWDLGFFWVLFRCIRSASGYAVKVLMDALFHVLLFVGPEPLLRAIPPGPGGPAGRLAPGFNENRAHS